MSKLHKNIVFVIVAIVVAVTSLTVFNSVQNAQIAECFPNCHLVR